MKKKAMNVYSNMRSGHYLGVVKTGMLDDEGVRDLC